MNEHAKKQISHEKSIKRLRIAIWILVAIAVALGGYLYVKTIPPPNGKYDAFAKCIANTTTTFYGAFWCPHCHDQKNEFGNSAQYLPYVECSLPDASGQTQVCIDNKIRRISDLAVPGRFTREAASKRLTPFPKKPAAHCRRAPT